MPTLEMIEGYLVEMVAFEGDSSRRTWEAVAVWDDICLA
jgi:hypothetical protein